MKILQFLFLVGFGSGYLFFPKTKGEFYDLVNTKPHLVALLVEGTKCKWCLEKSREALQELEHSHVAHLHELSFALINISQVTDLAKHFGIKHDYELFLFIRRQLVRIPKFSLSASESTNEKVIAGLVHMRFKHIDQKLNSLNALKKHLKRHSQIFLFLGENRQLEINFNTLAETHINVPFYHVPHPYVQDEIYEAYEHKPLQEGGLICIVRDSHIVTEMDPQMYCEPMSYIVVAEEFVDFERHPKLRLESHHENILRSMFWRKHVSMFLVSDNDKDLEKEFIEAVRILPRRFIFTITRSVDPDPDFQQIFTLGHQIMIPSSLYISYIKPNKTVVIERMSSNITKENIIDFAKAFYDNHKALWAAPMNFDQAPQNANSRAKPNDEL